VLEFAPFGDGVSARIASAACFNLQVYLISLFHSSLSPKGSVWVLEARAAILIDRRPGSSEPLQRHHYNN